ncbi:hypothetical protein D3C72_1910030 [compost metagenome]
MNSIPLEYIVEFPSGIFAHITISDEYYGHGNSLYDISLKGIIAYKEVSADELQEAAVFLSKAFNG